MRYHYFAISALLFVLGVVICWVHGLGTTLSYFGIAISFGPLLFWVTYGFLFGYFIGHQPVTYKMGTVDKLRMEEWFRENNGKALIYAYIVGCVLTAAIRFH